MSYASLALAKLKNALASTGFIRNAALLAGSAAVTQVIFLSLSPILTRVYSPEDFGILGVFVSVVSMALPLASWRYEYAITLPQDDDIAVNVLVLAIIILLGMTLLSGTGLLIFGDYIMKALRVSTGWYFSCLLVGGLFASGLFQALNFWALRKKAFSRIARTKLAQGSITAIGQVALGLLHIGPAGLLLGDVVGRTAGIRVLAGLLWTERSNLVGSVSTGQLLKVARRYKRFPYLSCGSGVLNAVGLSIPVVLMASLYGVQAAGFFSLALRLIGLPINLLGQAAGQVFWGEASRMYEDPERLSRLFYRVLLIMFLVSIAMMVPLVVVAPSALALVFGEQWREAGYYVQALSLGFVVDFMATPLSSTLFALERQSWQLGWDAGRLALMLLVFIGVHSLGFSPLIAALCYGLAQVLAYGIHLTLSAIAIRIAKNKISQDLDNGDLRVGFSG
ncbi:lipopolysaccharide biosynthesis protein [Desulfomonile tiedjei]|uniref:Membrane protein involved in the export of O-antigen and teichoic acid n=1 Tax=Desulfomonile tiedjei (strain ATCC 49306 / DSM 6799 / DCB-1) TaxID=706587 RepID=I4CBJ5_DESTA|nr:oligosaccharide flippase family protein [Desulfomonile tiedjei]AFM26936.1 membrane protein involved in the export of O-antigen and teichoic acid [Desulfomonile tiedjei DSM 6799]